MSEPPLTIHSRNGKIERWHKSLKSECIRPGTPLSLEDARRLIEGYVEHYNNVRLNGLCEQPAPSVIPPQRRTNLPGVDCSVFDKAQGILPGILDVERPLAPRPNYDAAARRIMHIFSRETIKAPGPLVCRFQVVYCKVKRLGRRVRLT